MTEPTQKAPVAVVTGASSGIGEATAQKLAEEGYAVALVARRATPLEALGASIREAGGEARAYPVDAADGAAVLTVAERVREDFGRPEVIVNSAGAGRWRFIEETPPDEAEDMLGAPYRAAYNVTHAFMSDMIDEERGVVVHVGSPAAYLPWPGATAYTTSRWALRGLHEALRQDLRGTGVSSCHVIFSEVSSAYFENNPGSHEHIPKAAKILPVITPERCAEVIAETIRRPRPLVLYPFSMRLFYWAFRAAPAPSRWLVARTGRQRAP